MGTTSDSSLYSLLTLLLVILLFVQARSDDAAATESTPASLMRAPLCVIPNGADHVTRAAIFQQCISDNYGKGNETRCYDELGCFSMDYPWTSLTRPLPSPLHPAEISTDIYCYTRASPTRYNVSLWPEITLGGCPFQANRTTMFLTHGFAADGNTTWMADLKDRYLKEVDANVFLVDWGRGAQLLNYLRVASNTRIVGAEVARFMRFLRSTQGLDASSLHLIGHSLGAHVSAYAAKNITGVDRLTALDPAQPGFEGTDKQVRLDKSDASYVEVVHTNAAPFLPTLGFGLMFPYGHVDFYMNGGVRQPGCSIPDILKIKSLQITGIGDLAKFPVEVVSNLVSCSHGRSYEYFSQSLQDNCTIWGRLGSLARHLLDAGTLGYIDPLFSAVDTCDEDTCIPMGLDTPRYEARGVFAASTPRRSPFCNDPSEDTKIRSDILRRSAKKVGEVATSGAKKTKEAVEGVASGAATVLHDSVGSVLSPISISKKIF